MTDFLRHAWVASFLRRSGLHTLVERYHREAEQFEARPRGGMEATWQSWLYRLRISFAFPLLVSVLALISAGTGLYPYGPVLVAAVVFAPQRWRSTYFAATLGAAMGAMVLAFAVQHFGERMITEYFPGLEHSEQWMQAEQWIETYGVMVLAAIAALPLPQLPPLLILSLTKTSPALIGLAILIGKLCKYGAYILAVQLILKAIHQGLRKISNGS